MISEKSKWILFGTTPDAHRNVLALFVNEGYLEFRTHFHDTATTAYSFTTKGWEKLATLQERTNESHSQAFVAMWFDPQMKCFYDEGFRLAIEAEGLRSFRVDHKEHNNKICDEITTEIKRSQVLVADFTGNRGGVYFEAGFAQGLGIPVIWCVHQDHLDEVHFDTRQYNHIVYRTPEDLKEKLQARIAATIRR